MDIGFRNLRLRKLCEEERQATRRLGPDSARKLRARLSDLEAVACVTDLQAGRPHPLTGDREGQFALDLAGGHRLVFSPADAPMPSREDGSIDWSRVTAVRIEDIGDYHD